MANIKSNTRSCQPATISILINYYHNPHLKILLSVYSSTVEYIIVYIYLRFLFIHGIYRRYVTLGDRQCTRFNGIGKLRVKLKFLIDVVEDKNLKKGRLRLRTESNV